MKKSLMFGLDNYLTLPRVWYALSPDSHIACRTEHEKACTEVLQSAVSVYRNVIVGGLAGYYPTQNDKSLLSVLGRVIYMMRHKHAELTEEQFGTCALLAADYESLDQTLNNLKEVPAFLLTKQASASTKKLYTKTIKRLHKFMRENVLGMFEKHAVCTKEVWDSVPQNIKRKWYVMKAEMSEGYLLNTVKRHEQLFTYEFLQLVSTKLMTRDTIVKILSHYEDFITSEERAVKKNQTSHQSHF